MKIVNLLDYPKLNLVKVSVSTTATNTNLELVVLVDVNESDNRTVVNAEEVGLMKAV